MSELVVFKSIFKVFEELLLYVNWVLNMTKTVYLGNTLNDPNIGNKKYWSVLNQFNAPAENTEDSFNTR